MGAAGESTSDAERQRLARCVQGAADTRQSAADEFRLPGKANTAHASRLESAFEEAIGVAGGMHAQDLFALGQGRRLEIKRAIGCQAFAQ
jgi:hypothetical protein